MIEILTTILRLYSHGKLGFCQSYITQIADYIKMFNRLCESWILFEEYTFSGGLHKKHHDWNFYPHFATFCPQFAEIFLIYIATFRTHKNVQTSLKTLNFMGYMRLRASLYIKHIMIEILTPTFRLYSHGKLGFCQCIKLSTT